MKKTEVKDEVLVRRYVRGNESCLEELLNRHQRRIFGYIMMLKRNRAEAEDIFQETFFRIIRKLKASEYSEEGKFLPWALRIAHNLCIDGFREDVKMPTVSHVRDKKTKEYIDIFSVLQPAEEHSQEADRLKAEQYRELKNLIQQLPQEQREVVILRTYYGMDFKEIAESTGTNLNTALGRMRYGILRLKKMAQDNEIFSEFLR